MPSRRFASSRSARLRGALFEMWAARTPVFAIASARRSRYLFDDGCEGSKSPGRVSPPELRLQELRIVRDVPEVAREEVHLRDAGVGVARELREVEERDLAVLLPPGVALLPELLAPLPLLLGHPRALRELPLLEEVADRPAVRGEPLQLLLARRRGGRRRARARAAETATAAAAAPPAALQEPATSQRGHRPVVPSASSGACHPDDSVVLKRRRPSAARRGSSGPPSSRPPRPPSRATPSPGSRPCAGSRRSSGSRGRACTTCPPP